VGKDEVGAEEGVADNINATNISLSMQSKKDGEQT